MGGSELAAAAGLTGSVGMAVAAMSVAGATPGCSGAPAVFMGEFD